MESMRFPVQDCQVFYVITTINLIARKINIYKSDKLKTEEQIVQMGGTRDSSRDWI